MVFPSPDFEVFSGGFGGPGTLGVEVWLKDSSGNPANKFYPDEPDITFVVSPYNGTTVNWPSMGQGLPDLDPSVGGPSGALGSAFLSAIKTFLEGFDWTSAYDWSSISVSTPVTVYKVSIRQIGSTPVTDVTP